MPRQLTLVFLLDLLRLKMSATQAIIHVAKYKMTAEYQEYSLHKAGRLLPLQIVKLKISLQHQKSDFQFVIKHLANLIGNLYE